MDGVLLGGEYAPARVEGECKPYPDFPGVERRNSIAEYGRFGRDAERHDQSVSQRFDTCAQRRCFDPDAYDLSAATGSCGNIVHISAHQLVIMTIFHQEGIMSMAGGDFRIADIQLVIQQRPDNSAGALWRKTPISSK